MADPHRRRLRPPVRLTLVDVSPDLAEHEAACATATAPPLPAALPIASHRRRPACLLSTPDT